MNQKEFTIRSYPKSELALLYFPDATPHVALNRLNSWIRRCPPLVDALSKPIDPPHFDTVYDAYIHDTTI